MTRWWSMVVLSPHEPVCCRQNPPKLLGVTVAERFTSVFNAGSSGTGNCVSVTTLAESTLPEHLMLMWHPVR